MFVLAVPLSWIKIFLMSLNQSTTRAQIKISIELIHFILLHADS